MRNIRILAYAIPLILLINCKLKSDQEKQLISFLENQSEKKIEVLANGKPFTTFQWPDNVCKPVLFPVFASSGTEITRGFPINPKAGERADHPHQIGMWLTYGNVNGTDFWGNGSKGLGTKNANGGIIRHDKIDKIKGGKGLGIIESNETWIDSSGIEILKEKTVFRFIAERNIRIIDRITQLTANERNVDFKDTKEGMFAIRVARQLELPSKGEIEMISNDGTVSKVKDTLNIGITGNYTSSEGITGEAVWGTRAKWMKLDGMIGTEEISVVICDHSQNPNYPTYWHARGYGLFSANPLGVKDFTKGKEMLDFSIPAGQSATFRYRVIIVSNDQITDAEIEKYSHDFEEKY